MLVVNCFYQKQSFMPEDVADSSFVLVNNMQFKLCDE